MNAYSYFQKKGFTLNCWYNVPWDVHATYAMFIDNLDHKKYNPTQNDDTFNIHNYDILTSNMFSLIMLQ